MEHQIMQYHANRQSVPLSYGSHLIVMHAPSIVWFATSSNFLGAVGMGWDTVWVWRGLGGALWCVSSAGGRQQSTLSKRLQVNCEVSRRAELDMWSHVVRRHMWRQSSTHPSQAAAHFFHLRPVVTANILLSDTLLTGQWFYRIKSSLNKTPTL